MTAQEMFEQLGYELDRNNNLLNYIDYWKNEETKYGVMNRRICFDLRRKRYYALYSFETVGIDMPTHRAIQKQIEELGWLEE